jgi:hypothetical protein
MMSIENTEWQGTIEPQAGDQMTFKYRFLRGGKMQTLPFIRNLRQQEWAKDWGETSMRWKQREDLVEFGFPDDFEKFVGRLSDRRISGTWFDNTSSVPKTGQFDLELYGRLDT